MYIKPQKWSLKEFIGREKKAQVTGDYLITKRACAFIDATTRRKERE